MRKKAFFILFFATIASLADAMEPNFSKFELVRGIIIVQAKLNGTNANFILDTGSPGMVLNTIDSNLGKWHERNPTEHLYYQGKTISHFQWAGIERVNLRTSEANMDMLEKLTNKPIGGLIGYDFLEGFELVLDFEQQLASLVSVSNNQDKFNNERLTKIPFEMAGHLPVVTAQIGGSQLRFGLDTGANTNLLDAKKLAEIDPSLITQFDESEMFGLIAFGQQAFAANIVETDLHGLVFGSMKYLFTDISHLKELSDNRVDGLLGFPFFQSGKFSINYATKELSIMR